MMNHTPGKWAVDLETGEITAANGQVSIGTIYGSDDFPCLDLEDNDEGVQAFVAECQANARLIAAAPDLLAENTRLQALVDEATSIIDKLIYDYDATLESDAAVSKAAAAWLERAGTVTENKK